MQKKTFKCMAPLVLVTMIALTQLSIAQPVDGTPGTNSQTVIWKSTTAQNPWVDKGTIPMTTWDNDQTLYIDIDEEAKYQEIDGWGGALNEYGWVAMSVLSQTERDKVLKALFDTSGCAINIGRISMGANDYSLSFYSCCETPGDYAMSSFSLAKEKVNVIPFALAAKAINPAMKFWGSPHSPPAWMKQNNSLINGSLKTDDTTRKAYALYFEKWVQGMAAEQIPIYAVHVQNEPNIAGTGYPTCIMTGAEMGTLIKDYIGPQFKKTGLSTEIWAGTLHSGISNASFYPDYIPPTLGDAATSAFISGVGMQWNALADAPEVTKNFPTKRTMQTETQCGNYHWTEEFNHDFAPNDWAYGVFTAHRMIQWLRAGVNAYCQWNMVLDEIGNSNNQNFPWPQNSMISINKTTKEVRYNPQFYAVKHFGYFVKKGAKRIATSGNYSTGGNNLLSKNLGEAVTDGDMIAFVNPNGDKVLVLRNTTASDKAVAIKVGTSKFKPVIPANSINTFLIKSSVAIRKFDNSKKPDNISVCMSSGSVKMIIPIPESSVNSSISISIIDASGRVVKEFNEKVLTSASISVNWDGRNENGDKMAPGIYLTRIKSGNNVLIRTIALPM